MSAGEGEGRREVRGGGGEWLISEWSSFAKAMEAFIDGLGLFGYLLFAESVESRKILWILIDFIIL